MRDPSIVCEDVKAALRNWPARLETSFPKLVAFEAFHHTTLRPNGVPEGDPLRQEVPNDASVSLFRFHGTTYFEIRPGSESQDRKHEVWKLSADGSATKMCAFTTDRGNYVAPLTSVPPDGGDD